MKLLKYAVDFFHQDPTTQLKLKPGKKSREGKREESHKAKRSPSRSMSQEREKSLTKKFAKYDNLRPLSNFILSALESYEVPHFKTKKIVGEIIDRIVTAGYSWDKLLCYHSKGNSHFTKKLIPYFFMSKDELPDSLGPEKLLAKLFDFIARSVNEVSMGMMGSPPSSRPLTSPSSRSMTSPSSRAVASPPPRQEPEYQKTSLLSRSRNISSCSSDKMEDKPMVKKDSNRIVLAKEDWPLPLVSKEERQMVPKRKIKDDSSASSDSEDEDSRRKKHKRKRKPSSRGHSASSSSSDDENIKKPSSTAVRNDVKNEPKSPSLSSDASSNDLDKMMASPPHGDKSKQKQSLLEKVNDIIKSCVKLKDEKKISGVKLEKANKIIAKAEAKRAKLLKQESEEIVGEDNQKNNNDAMDDTLEIKHDDTELVSENDKEEEKDEQNKEDVEEGEITDDEEEENNDDVEVTIEEEVKVKEKKKKKKHRKEHRRRNYSSDSHQGTVDDELRAMAGHDNRLTRLTLDHERTRSRSRSGSWSEPEHSYRRKAAEMAASQQTRYKSHRSRTPSTGSEESEPTDLNRWIPITPCTVTEDAEVEPMSTAVVSIKAKGEFSFRDNPGCFVR